MTEERVCPTCRSDMSSMRPNKKFCSHKCKYTSDNLKRARAVARACRLCGKEIPESKGKNLYCSEECSKTVRLKRDSDRRKKYVKKKAIRGCAYCNAEMYGVKYKDKTYCSDICRDRAADRANAWQEFSIKNLTPMSISRPEHWGFSTEKAWSVGLSHKYWRIESFIFDSYGVIR